jgi:hypothetical protein
MPKFQLNPTSGKTSTKPPHYSTALSRTFLIGLKPEPRAVLELELRSRLVLIHDRMRHQPVGTEILQR